MSTKPADIGFADNAPTKPAIRADSDRARVRSLDFLRGLAIMLVVLTHADLSFPANPRLSAALSVIGNQGVQLFFLVSAWTMCLMWHGREGEEHRLGKFYIRRLIRIAIPYWGGLILYVGFVNFHPAEQDAFGIALNAVFLHGFWPRAINSVVPGGWSIAVEMTFYLVFPLLTRLDFNRLVLVAMAWLILVSIGAASLLKTLPPLFIYYSILTQLPVFLIGMASYTLLHRERVKMGYWLAVIVAWIAIAVVARHFGFEGRPFFWVGIFLLAGVAIVCIHFNISVGIVSFLGRQSYSMYLLHVALLWGLVRLAPSLPLPAAFVILLLLTSIVAFVSQRTIERWSQACGRWLIARLYPSQRRPLPR